MRTARPASILAAAAKRSGGCGHLTTSALARRGISAIGRSKPADTRCTASASIRSPSAAAWRGAIESSAMGTPKWLVPWPTPGRHTRTPTRVMPAAARRRSSASVSAITSAPSLAARSSRAGGFAGPCTTIVRPPASATERARQYSASQATWWPMPFSASARRMAGRRLALCE